MEALPPRNSTNFALALREALRAATAARPPNDPLQLHQRLVHDYFVHSGVRGFYAMHRMGAGKTRLAIAIAESTLERGPAVPGGVSHVIFLAAKTLHDNFREELRNYLAALGKTAEEIARHEARYQFVSSNASNMLQQMQRPELLEVNLDNTLVIVDEAHELTNAITNGSKNATAFYHMTMESKGVRLLFLSGTPVVNDPYELGVAFNMLAGPLAEGYGASGRKRTTLFGEDYRRFVEAFVDVPSAMELESNPEAAGRGIKNREKFINRILGMVSYYDPRQCDGTGAAHEPPAGAKVGKGGSKADSKSSKASKAPGVVCLADRFPELRPLQVVRVPMAPLEYSRYRLARAQEREEEARRFGVRAAPLTKGTSDSSSTYRILSRQLSNYLYPEHAGRLHSVDGRLRYERDLEKLRASDFTAAALMEHGPKLAVLVRNVLRHLPWAATGKLPEIMAAADAWEARHEKARKEDVAVRGGAVKPGKGARSKDRVPKGISTDSSASGSSASKDTSKKFTPGPGIVYSQFKDSGVALIAAILQAHGWEAISGEDSLLGKVPSPKAGTPRFIFLTGEQTPEERTALLALRNAPGNEEGWRVALLLVTEVAARGINTLGTTHVHQAEGYWNYSRTEQVVARADRLGSHLHLPEAQRVVHPYLYLAVLPADKVDEQNLVDHRVGEPVETLSTDEFLYLKSITRLQISDSFVMACRAASVDCALWSATVLQEAGLRCQFCNPTGRPLFVPDLSMDLESPSPCVAPVEKKVRTETVRLSSPDVGDVREYQWYRDGAILHILRRDPRLGTFLPLPLTHPDYALVVELLEH